VGKRWERQSKRHGGWETDARALANAKLSLQAGVTGGAIDFAETNESAELVV
jgi:hypothetical protein